MADNIIKIECPNCGTPKPTAVAWPIPIVGFQVQPADDDQAAERARRALGSNPYCEKCMKASSWTDWSVTPRASTTS